MFTILENYKTLMKMCMSAGFEGAPSVDRVDSNMDGFVDQMDLGNLNQKEREIVKNIITQVYQSADIAQNVEAGLGRIDIKHIQHLLGARQTVTNAVNTGGMQVYGDVVQSYPAAAQSAPQSYVSGVSEAMQGQPLPVDGRYVDGVLYDLGNGQTGTYDEATCSFSMGEANYGAANESAPMAEFGGACPVGTPGCNPKYGNNVETPTTPYAVTPSVDQPQTRYVVPDCAGAACDLNGDGIDDRVAFKDNLDTVGFYVGNHPEVQWYGAPTSGRGQEIIRTGVEGYDYVITQMELPGCQGLTNVVIEPKPEYKDGLSFGNGPHNMSSYSQLRVDHAETIDSPVCGVIVNFPTLKKGGTIDPGGLPDDTRPGGIPSSGFSQGTTPTAGGNVGGAQGTRSF